MREALIGAGMLMLVGSAAVRAQAPSPLDAPTTLRLPSTLSTCGVNTVILALARTSRVMTGFEERREESLECQGHFAHVDVTHVDKSDSSVTVRQILDQLIALAPDYQWAEMDGVAVIRPVAAWMDPTDVLNGRTAPLNNDAATVGETLATILRMPTPRVRPLNFNKPPFAMAFDGGTMIDALNRLVRSQGGDGWMARVWHSAGVDALQLAVRTFNVGDRTGVDGAISMGTPMSRHVAAR